MCRIIAANVGDRQAGRPERESAKLGWPISCTEVPQRLAFPSLEIPEALITSDMQGKDDDNKTRERGKERERRERMEKSNGAMEKRQDYLQQERQGFKPKAERGVRQ